MAVQTAFDEPRPATRGSVGEAGLSIPFTLLKGALRAAAAAYFGRFQVLHRERLPARGPALVVANHPATWTDVLVLDVALGRKLHFLARSDLYRPWVRALLLAFHGAMPVTASQDASDAASRNAKTFQRCHELFDRGRVVAMFPEGSSSDDRCVRTIRPGAARIALGYSERPAALGLSVVPVGIHYADRMAIRSDVTVNIGEPVPLQGFVERARHDREAAVADLTAHLHRALNTLILDRHDPLLAAAVSDLGPLAAGVTAPFDLESMRRFGAWLERLKDADAAAFASVVRHRRLYVRARTALGLTDRSLIRGGAATGSPTRAVVLTAVCLLGAAPALAGSVVHAIPWFLAESIARRVAPEPTRLAFARISSGAVLFSATYGIIAWMLLRVLRLPALSALGVLVGLVLLGAWARVHARWVGELRERFRLHAHRRRHPRLLERAREECRVLERMLAGSIRTVP